MYSFPYFKEKKKKVILEFITDNPFAFVTGSDLKGRQVATQIPILIEERQGELFLQGHIMKNTDHQKAFMENPQTLIVFSGAHSYVSASWYSDSQMGSTWNYMSVHVGGTIRFMSDEELVQFMKRFTLRFEENDRQSPTIYDNLPTSYLNKMMNGIVGLEIKADKIEHVFKLSQNRDESSYRNIVSKLNDQGGNAVIIAKEMQKRLDQLFKADSTNDKEE